MLITAARGWLFKTQGPLSCVVVCVLVTVVMWKKDETPLCHYLLSYILRERERGGGGRGGWGGERGGEGKGAEERNKVFLKGPLCSQVERKGFGGKYDFLCLKGEGL